MSTPSSPSVLIAGAGAAGLTLAIDLARRNVPLRIIDKAEVPFSGSRGKGIQPRTQEVFEDLAVLDRIAGRGGPYPKIRLYGPSASSDVTMMEAGPATPAEPYGEPLMLPQGLTEGVLRERLAELGVTVEFGTELSAFEDKGQAVEATLSSSAGAKTVRASYLVGADGGSSFVRKALGVGFPGQSLPVRAVVADLPWKGSQGRSGIPGTPRTRRA
jgi:2-polyprenyl-6-methoxyphenol hydroxylase-like FAD-dependent oxidoreductase